MEVLTLLEICLISSVALGGLWLIVTDKTVGVGDFVSFVTTSVVLMWLLVILLSVGAVFGVVKLSEAAIGLLQRVWKWLILKTNCKTMRAWK